MDKNVECERCKALEEELEELRDENTLLEEDALAKTEAVADAEAREGKLETKMKELEEQLDELADKIGDARKALDD